MLKKKDPSILNLALLVSLSTALPVIPVLPEATSPAWATTSKGTTAQLDDADATAALKQHFRTQSLKTTIELKARETLTASPATRDAKVATTDIFNPVLTAPSEGLLAVDNRNQNVSPTSDSNASKSGISAWWWLLPLGFLGLLIWWLQSRRSHSRATASPDETTTASSETDIPAADSALQVPVSEDVDPAFRAEAVIHADRAAIAETQSPASLAETIPEIAEPDRAVASEVIEDVPVIVSTEATAAVSSHSDSTAADPPQVTEASSVELSTLDVIEELNELEAKIDEVTEEFEPEAPTVLDLTETGTLVETADLLGVEAIVSQPGTAATVLSNDAGTQINVEAARFDVGQTDLTSETLATVDQGLAELPDGYGESRIVLLPRDPQWAYAYWDVSNEHKLNLRQQGGQRLALRLYDVTDVDVNRQSPHSLQQFDCDELAREWYVSIPVSDRDYLIEIGYLTESGHWLTLARSATVRIPPVYPSDWFEDQFVTIDWDEDLRAKTFLELIPPGTRSAATASPIYEQIFGLAQGAEAQRVIGSLFGSMQQVPQQAISSFVFPSGVGGWALPTPSGMGLSGINMSGVGMSGAGLLTPPNRPRRFWLVADAELIIYGATEPDATVTIAGQPIKLNPDGTFRFQMSFQDGLIDYPIFAIAADNEQTRSIHLKFNRETPHRHTNTSEEATDEWF